MMVYLSGPMTGYPNLNKEAFDEMDTLLTMEGYTVINPATLDESRDWNFGDYLKRDLKFMLSCDAVFVLPKWSESRGACLEVFVANSVGMPIYDAVSKDLITHFTGMKYYAVV